MASEMAKGRALADRHGKHIHREGTFSISLAQTLLKWQCKCFIFLWVTKDILCRVLKDIKILWVNFNLTYTFHERRIFHLARLFFFFNYLLNFHSFHVNLVAFLFVLEMVILRYIKEKEWEKTHSFLSTCRVPGIIWNTFTYITSC